MSRENRNLILNAILALLLSITMVLGYDAFANRKPEINTDALSELFGEDVTLADEETLTNDHVKLRKNVLNASDEVVGAIYTLETGDVDYSVGTGNAEIIVTINKDKQLLAYEFGTYEHTEGFKANVETMLNSMIDNNTKIDSIDTSLAEGTGSTFSAEAVLETLIKLNDFIDGKVVEPEVNKYDELFGVTTKLGTITNINIENLISEQPILNESDEVLGTSYILDTGVVVYFGSSEGNVKFEVIVDQNETLLGYEFVEYTHTEGFKGNVEEMLDSIISDAKTLTDIDLTLAEGTGSTNSSKAIIEILIKLKGYLDGDIKAPTKYDLLFGETTVLGEVETISNDNVLSKQVISSSEDVILGTSFILNTGDTIYVGTSTASIELEVIIDVDETILGYEFKEYNHTGGFRNNVETLLNGLISENKTLTDLDLALAEGTGSTNSNKAIIDVLIALRDYLGGE